MTPERWQRALEILDGAPERAAPDRAAFLDEVCAGDAALRHKVEELLRADGQADHFLEALLETPLETPPLPDALKPVVPPSAWCARVRTIVDEVRKRRQRGRAGGR